MGYYNTMDQIDFQRFSYLFEVTNELAKAFRNPRSLSKADAMSLLSDICSVMSRAMQEDGLEEIIYSNGPSNSAELVEAAQSLTTYMSLLDLEESWFRKTNLSLDAIELLVSSAADLRGLILAGKQYNPEEVMAAYNKFKDEVCDASCRMEDVAERNVFVENMVRGTGVLFGAATLVVNSGAMVTPGGQMVGTISLAWSAAFFTAGSGAGRIRRWFFGD